MANLPVTTLILSSGAPKAARADIDECVDVFDRAGLPVKRYRVADDDQVFNAFGRTTRTTGL